MTVAIAAGMTATWIGIIVVLVEQDKRRRRQTLRDLASTRRHAAARCALATRSTVREPVARSLVAASPAGRDGRASANETRARMPGHPRTTDAHGGVAT